MAAAPPQLRSISSVKHDRLRVLLKHETAADPEYIGGEYELFRNHATQLIQKCLELDTDDTVDKHPLASYPLASYHALQYFDRLVLKNQACFLNSDDAQRKDLFILCCYGIARKMSSKEFKMKELLAKLEKQCYVAKDVHEMENQICNNLKWELICSTPHTFAEYYFDSFLPEFPVKEECHKELNDFFVKLHSDIRTTVFIPSLIAARALVIVLSEKHPDCISIFEDALKKSGEETNMVASLLSTDGDLKKICEELWGTSISE